MKPYLARLAINGRVYILTPFMEWESLPKVASDEILETLNSQFRPEHFPQSLDVWPSGRLAALEAGKYYGFFPMFPERPQIPEGARS